MAEAAVEFAIETLSSLLVQEVKLLGNARQEVESIKSELESIRSCLKDADAKAAAEDEGRSSQGVKTWVKQLREEAYHIEDVLDEYILKTAQLPHGSGFLGVLRKISRFVKKPKSRHEVATAIQDIKSSLDDIKRRRQNFNFRDEGSNSGIGGVIPHDSRVGSIFIEDSEIVGIESSKQKLIDLLMNGKSNLSVIGMVGEGGLGKTTLAGKIYDNDVVKKHFDCQAWITIGKEYVKKDLLKTIKQEVCRQTGYPSGEIEDMEETNEMNLMIALRKLLKDKCYMVVFDDVWKDDFWEDVKYALLDDNKGSRVMLTTRYMTIAHSVPSVIVHELEHLPSDKSWELFCRKVFGFNVSCPTELEKLSYEILAKCGGLPLAIVAVGGILSNKNKVVSEWQKLLGGLGSKLGSDPHLRSCNRVLSEGYYDLPHHLKSCLSYFALFPQGFEIKFGRLIRLWIAEGFVQYSKNCSLEQVAEDYLTELLDRSLVQVPERRLSRRVETCKVHDLMHEILLKKTKELGFYGDLSGEDLSHKTRRISVNKGNDDALERVKDSKIRSICLFNVDNLPQSFMGTFFANFKLLKILDFEDGPVEYLPDGVGKLFHLHYLGLRRTNIKELPKSIGMLINLETLDLKYSFVSELPVEINNLKKLRCLIVWHRDDFSPKIHEGLGALTNLHKLYFVEANSKVLEELKQLRQLRRLDIKLESRFLKDLFAIVEKMENLESLGVRSQFEEEILDISYVASPPQCLQSLFLEGNIKKLPFWIFELQKLIKIQLVYTGATDIDPISLLQALPNLLRLIIYMKYCDEKLYFKEGWFPKLEVLYLSDFGELKWMMIDKGSMPNLKEFWIGPCPLLKEVPTGIEHLTHLKRLIFEMMLKEIYWMIKNENWEKETKHIPDVSVSCKEADGKYFTYNTRYLSSLSFEDFEQLVIEELGPSDRQSHP